MNAERWNQVQTLFKEILELDHDSRVTRLNEVRDTDDELFREIQSLLAADADHSSILDGFAIDAIDISGLLSIDGTRVGPFEIVRQVGSGGMGNVYLAKRVEGGFEQTVALKLIKYGMDSEQILRRFESERQILARLQHPNIARLVDGGIKDDGRPWFAMDYVQGEPIDEYCNRKDLDMKKRLELFLTVLSAVQYAHRNLVVHRDLKPHNILVHQDGDSVEIKLLDFGIARLLSEDEEQTALTQEGVRPMTRSYASPEQLKGESVTTASDVYSLGVILYELLTGRRPFEQKELSSVEFEKLICTSVPPKPSQILSKGTENDGERPDKFQKKRLIKQLAGDLDMICLKALRLEPDKRYDTADQFAEDIKRHLAELPILARPVSKSYQAQKFVRRHTVGVLATLLILLSLVGGIIAFAWQYRVAALERDRAQREADTATEIAGFLQGLFEVADPAISRGDTITARQLLERGSRQIEQELAEQPEVLARMLDVLGNVYLSLWMLDESESMFEKSLNIRQERQGISERNLQIATSLYNIGRVSTVKGAFAKADSMLSQSLDIRQAALAKNHLDIARVLIVLSQLQKKQGKYEAAEKNYFEALSILELSRDDKDVELHIAGLKNNLGNLFEETGEFERSETYLRQALEYNRDYYKADHPSIETNMNNLARVLNRLAKYEEAKELFLASLEMSKRLYGEMHPKTALNMNNYSSFLKDREKYIEAETFQLQALDIFLEKLGEDHPYIPMCYNNLANLRDDQGDYETAGEYHEKALERNRAIYGNEHGDVANSLSNLGSLRLNQERYKEAESLFREALRIDSKAFGEAHPYVAMDYQSVGITLFEQGKYTEAEEHLVKSVALNTAVLGEAHPNTAIAKGELGRLLLKTGRLNEAEKILKEVLAQHEKDQPENSWRTAEIRSLFGESLIRTGRYEEAKSHLTEGHKILLQSHGEDHRFTVRARARLILLHEALGDSTAANR